MHGPKQDLDPTPIPPSNRFQHSVWKGNLSVLNMYTLVTLLCFVHYFFGAKLYSRVYVTCQ